MAYYRLLGEKERKGNRWREKTEPFRAANLKDALRKMSRMLRKMNDEKNGFYPDEIQQVTGEKVPYAVRHWKLELVLAYRIKKNKPR